MIDSEITVDSLSEIDLSSYDIIDIRSETDFACGHLPSAVNIPADRLMAGGLRKDRNILIYCRNGRATSELIDELCEQGYSACMLKGGYNAWLRAGYKSSASSAENDTARAVEESIRGKFRKKLLSPFRKAIDDYGLIKRKDKIAVCISGGKDSFLMAKLFQEYQKHSNTDISLVFLVMDPGYADSMDIIERNAAALGIPLTVFKTNVFDSIKADVKNPCYLCARMRRGYLYDKAKELGCNKIALGHHYDDVIETVLLGMLYGGKIETMLPILQSENYSGMELIRPMYLVRENDIKAWRDENGLSFINCACPLVKSCSTDDGGSKRQAVKKLIATLKVDNPYAEKNIFKSMENVDLSSVLGYIGKDGKRHGFRDK